MTIYTRGGDEGRTSTLGEERLPKDHPVLEANGTLDELSAVVGLTRARGAHMPHFAPVAALLRRLQDDFLHLGAYISSGDEAHLAEVGLVPEVMEKAIDAAIADRQIESFVIPGANEVEALFHLARTVCRRFERRLTALAGQRPDPAVRKYANRLSDLFFALAVWSKEPLEPEPET